MNLDDILDITLQMSEIDESYYPDIRNLIEKSKNSLKSRKFTGSASKGLLTVQVNNKGIIEKLDIASSLIVNIQKTFCDITNSTDSSTEKQIECNAFNEQISALCKIAHTEAIENVEKANNEQAALLDSEIVSLLADGTYA